MKVLILSFLVLSVSGFAADKKVVVAGVSKTSAVPETLEIDSKTTKEEITELTTTLSNKNPMKANVICKKSDGDELKQGDEGYEACIQKVKKNKNSKSDRKAEAEVEVHLEKH